MFFIIYIVAYAFSNAGAEEPQDDMKLECSMFIQEEICNMSADEQQIFFLEFFKQLIDKEIKVKQEEKEEGVEV